MKHSYGRLGILVWVLFMLTVISLPTMLQPMRPLWILLLILYVQFMLPHMFYLIGVVVFGLLLDTLTVSVMGEHAFALLCVCWAGNVCAKGFRFFRMTQQMIWIAVLSFIYQCVLFILSYIQGYAIHPLMWILPVLVSTLLWPLLSYLFEQWIISKKTCLRTMS